MASMRALTTVHDQEPGELIAHYVEQNPHRPGLGDARVIGSGVSVAAIFTALLTAGGDRRAVAADYDLPEAAVQAAIWYYALHKDEVDARIARDAFPIAAGANAPLRSQ